MTANDFPTAEFLAWARMKPAKEGYCSIDLYHCAVAQFGRATGRMYLIGVGDLVPLVGSELVPAIILSDTFGELVTALERVIEPSLRKRLWARLTGKTIGLPRCHQRGISDTWTKVGAYRATAKPVWSVSEKVSA